MTHLKPEVSKRDSGVTVSPRRTSGGHGGLRVHVGQKLLKVESQFTAAQEFEAPVKQEVIWTRRSTPDDVSKLSNDSIGSGEKGEGERSERKNSHNKHQP